MCCGSVEDAGMSDATEREMSRIPTWAKMKGLQVAQFIHSILCNPCFRRTGIVPEDMDAVQWTTQRSTCQELDLSDMDAHLIGAELPCINS